MSAMASKIACQVSAQTFVQKQLKKIIKAPSPAFVRVIHRWPVDSPHKGPVTQNSICPFDDVIMLADKNPCCPVICQGYFLKIIHLIFIQQNELNNHWSIKACVDQRDRRTQLCTYEDINNFQTVRTNIRWFCLYDTKLFCSGWKAAGLDLL